MDVLGEGIEGDGINSVGRGLCELQLRVCIFFPLNFYAKHCRILCGCMT